MAFNIFYCDFKIPPSASAASATRMATNSQNAKCEHRMSYPWTADFKCQDQRAQAGKFCNFLKFWRKNTPNFLTIFQRCFYFQLFVVLCQMAVLVCSKRRVISIEWRKYWVLTRSLHVIIFFLLSCRKAYQLSFISTATLRVQNF